MSKRQSQDLEGGKARESVLFIIFLFCSWRLTLTNHKSSVFLIIDWCEKSMLHFWPMRCERMLSVFLSLSQCVCLSQNVCLSQCLCCLSLSVCMANSQCVSSLIVCVSRSLFFSFSPSVCVCVCVCVYLYISLSGVCVSSWMRVSPSVCMCL